MLEVLSIVPLADEFARQGKSKQAESLYTQVVKTLEATAPESLQLAEALIGRCFARFGLARNARVHGKKWMSAAIDDYSRGVIIREKAGCSSALAGDMINLGAMLYRDGRYSEALVWHEKALLVAESLRDPSGTGRLAAWNHLGGTLCATGRFDEAERVLQTGLKILEESHPDRLLLIDSLADIYEARAKTLREQVQNSGGTCCSRPSKASDEPAQAEEVRDEFVRLFVAPGSGIHSAEVRQDDSTKLEVFLYDWSAAQRIPSVYRTLEIVLAAYVPPAVALSPSAIVDGPGPELVRQ
jgi:tetratricopeptide (TPR) repeat protein